MVGHVLVADAAHGGYAVPKDGAEFAAQPGHMDIDGTAVADVSVPPDIRDEGITRVNRVGVGHEVVQKVELQVGEVEFAPIDLDQSACAIDSYGVIGPDGIGVGVRFRLRSPKPLGLERMDLRAYPVRCHQRHRVDVRRQVDEVSDATAIGPAGGDAGRVVADQMEARARVTAGGGCGEGGRHDEPLRLLGMRYACRLFGHGRARGLHDGYHRRFGTANGPVRLRRPGHERRNTRGMAACTAARHGEMP